ncbi:MAG: hypothetical protein QE279_08680 [Rhodoferax sp.]|nr:hypothetical protein [Rhodoferax sp.]
MSNTDDSAQSFVDLLPAKQRQAIVAMFGDTFAQSFMGPIAFIDDAQLSSPTVTTFFRRDFPFISRVLNYEYQYRSWNGFDQELLNRYGDLITKKLENITLLLTRWTERFNKLLEANGVKMESAVYSNAVLTTVPIISGHARAYFHVLKELDRLNLAAGTANLYGVITSTQRAEAEFTCKKAVRAFAAALRNEVLKLYKEAGRLQREQQGRGQVEPAQVAVIASQGTLLEEFGESMSGDAKADRSLDLAGVDPGQVIDDASAATVAAGKASAKLRSKKDETLGIA